ncbi:MAG: cyclic nucleotide-binding domain-containing protein [Ignavibacteriae bacterium]|nr:cyclic nucleotide-binding domain-containing protein [Ignavibacteriota bacterium]
MNASQLGKLYCHGEAIVRAGESGDCMYVIQAGQVRIVKEREGKEVELAVLNEGDFFGEMSIFNHEVRSATVYAIGDVRLLTVDKKSFLHKVHQDPSLAFSIVEKLSCRVRELNEEVTRLKTLSSYK